jgi:hypothetical protein
LLKQPLSVIGAAIVLLLATSVSAGGQQSPLAAGPVGNSFRDSSGDLNLAQIMLLVQLRHIKLGLAGRFRNWPFAR